MRARKYVSSNRLLTSSFAATCRAREDAGVGQNSWEPDRAQTPGAGIGEVVAAEGEPEPVVPLVGGAESELQLGIALLLLVLPQVRRQDDARAAAVQECLRGIDDVAVRIQHVLETEGARIDELRAEL